MPMNMSDIARLAGVKRPVVSMWRTRHGQGARHPFPTPLRERGDRGAVLFEDREILEWLRTTGLGNNREAAAEQPLHSEMLLELASNPDPTSSLLLLQHLTQQPLQDLTPKETDEALLMAQLPPALLPPELDLTAPEYAALLPAVDSLTEAAYSPEHALARVVAAFPRTSDDCARLAFSPAGQALFRAVLDEVRAETALPVVPVEPEALTLLAQTSATSESGTARSFTALQPTLRTAHGRAAWRLLAAQGHVVSASSESDGDALPSGACLALSLLAEGTSPTTAATRLDEILLAVGPEDRALVIGPTSLLTNEAGAAHRRELLANANASGITLRYAARLPKNLFLRSTRHRLAVWVLAGQDSVAPTDAVVTADHGDARLDAAAVQAIAADIAVVMTGDESALVTHAFRAGGPQRRDRAQIAAEITAPLRAASTRVLGSDLLAEALNADADLVATLNPTADRRAEQESRVTWAELAADYGRDLPGIRLPVADLQESGPGTVAAIGPEELRGVAAWGARRIDRLRLEGLTPRARFTQPKDVIYVASGGPAAVVDDDGGHLVLAPARIFRAGLPQGSVARQWRALPAVVAADIATQRVPDKDAWRIRLAPRDRAEDVERLRREAATRRAELQGSLDRLNHAEQSLLQALASGTARLGPPQEHDDALITTTSEDQTAGDPAEEVQ
ncbi:hypothetical protein M3C74_02050 [Micrococcus lylae]|uniref:hypothetical protein n=1 Tax=Micrococcus lylae TaxID=1273 RepID=UPI0021A50844|nr:hypothetical protein [Micrococcus lylae]MCT2006807.1 hypothetical protein [Micrococcus lylae]MCT2070627.1 hypothetical protein [Micrococcus lylae]